MNKTIIALAITAALPVAAQADLTLSGTLVTKYTQGGSTDTDSRLSISTSEVLANGMTATATFAITGDADDDTENQGTATLAGDFGKLTIGEIDADGSFQAGDVANTVLDTTEGASSTSSTVYGIHFSGEMAGLNVNAQLNGATGPDGKSSASVAAQNVANQVSHTAALLAAQTAGDTAEEARLTLVGASIVRIGSSEPSSTQAGVTYDFNGLTVGYSYASGDADSATLLGVHAAQTAFGASYAFGDLVVTAGKTSINAEARISATYTMAVDAITVVAQMDNEPSGDYQIDLSYALSDGVTLSSEIDSTAGKQTTLVASYTSGDMTTIVSKTDDGSTDASIALDLGNADLTLSRDGGAQTTSVKYAVAF